jgi:hypothetical protein
MRDWLLFTLLLDAGITATIDACGGLTIDDTQSTPPPSTRPH